MRWAGFEPASLAYETSKEPLLYPAILYGRIFISTPASLGLGIILWTGDKSSFRALAATSPHYPFVWCIGVIHHFFEFKKPDSQTEKTLSFSNVSSLETTHFTSEMTPAGIEPSILPLKGANPSL